MSKALIILHAGPDEENPRADTAVRLAGAIIGANAVVLMDVPPYATAVGAPARIIMHEDTTPQSSLELE
ncbi:hypothetical protein HF289_03170 [Acidithiobacillus ferrooxidans]|uniref:hypothetical protein n=1 Tax=Acidithiobacillus ferrooxidans TaxID=920 RepID=UPI001D0221F6|nr:hypothetical protein [Acidithiobacillus ferrooxidans]MBU2855913.1 hypothetical protein [Acidithiobacillus ferrooxidans]